MGSNTLQISNVRVFLLLHFQSLFFFSLSVLNLFPGLESSPISLPAGFCEVLLGMERAPCPLREPGPMLLVWPAGDLRARSLPADQRVGGSTGSYTQGFWPHYLVGIRIKTSVPCFAQAELTGARLGPSRPCKGELIDCCQVYCEPPREPPAPPRRGFWWGLAGFQHGWNGGAKCRAQPSAWKSSLSWGRADTVPEETHQTFWTAKPKQQHCGMPQVTPGFTGVYTSTSPPWSFSCTLSAPLALWHCPRGKASRGTPSAQPCPLPRLLGMECFWDLCSSLGCGLGQMGFAVVGKGGGVKLHEQAHTHSHTEKI